MGQPIQDVMKPDPVTVDASESLPRAAQLMRDNDIGDVFVTQQGAPFGIVTDRDIVVRAVANSEGTLSWTVGDICSTSLVSCRPSDDVEDAIRAMNDHALRRVPIVDDNEIVGVVSLGDLAIERDPGSVLSNISAAPPNT
ncbi:MAG: CBS domain-containing protein [Acidimicrobiales bacterium]